MTLVYERLFWSLLLIFGPMQHITGDYGDPYGLISKVKTECEYEALTIGSKLVDQFNIYDEGTEMNFRLQNDYLVEHLGFARWVGVGLDGSGLTATEQSSASLREVGYHLTACLTVVYRSIASVLFMSPLTYPSLFCATVSPDGLLFALPCLLDAA